MLQASPTSFQQWELFGFLDSQLVEEIDVGALPCTSNRLEGGINSPIKNMLRNHRGMPETMMRACEWMCTRTLRPEAAV